MNNSSHSSFRSAPLRIIKDRQKFLTVLILLLHCVYIFLSYLQVSLNSDHASQVLEAADILGGNVFLKGWNLTGVSFYFSELPFYVLGTLIAGVDTYAYIIAAAAMVICLSISGYLLAAADRGTAVSPVLIYLAAVGFPTLDWLGYLRGHCAVFVYLFVILLCVHKIFLSGEGRPALFIVSGILTACGIMSDMLLLVIGIVPILCFCIVNLLRNQDTVFPRGKTLVLAGTSMIACAAGVLMDRVLMRIGGINKNSFLDTRSFIDLDYLSEKLQLFGRGLFSVFRMSEMWPGVSVREFFAGCFGLALILIFLYYLFKTLRDFFVSGSADLISVILCLSVLLQSAVCLFTDVYSGDDSARYIAWFPFAAGIVICRNLRLSGIPAGAAVFVFLAAGLLFGSKLSYQRAESPQDRLAAFLESNRLTEGYSDFWNSSHTTVASGGRVTVRAIRGRVPELGHPDHLEMQNWFCKTEWYLPETFNFIVFDGKDYLHVSEDVVTALLGSPDRILDNGEYRVYVYDRRISDRISIPDDAAAVQ